MDGSGRLHSHQAHARLGRRAVVGAGGEARTRFRGSGTSVRQRIRAPSRPLGSRRARTARSVVVWPQGSPAMRASMAVPARAGSCSCSSSGRGMRRLSRRAVVDNGDTPRRPNLSLLFASVFATGSRPTASTRPTWLPSAHPAHSTHCLPGPSWEARSTRVQNCQKPRPTHLHQRMLSRYFVAV